jgi:hypothetical protein
MSETEHVDQYQDLYQPGALNPDVHKRIVINCKEVLAAANIPKPYLIRKIGSFCLEDEIKWVRALQKHKDSGELGLLFTHECERVLIRMMGMCGCLLRNFINAKIFYLQEIIDESPRGDECSVFLVPNFHLSSNDGGSIPNWQIPKLTNWLIERQTKSQPYILGIHSLEAVEQSYGPNLRAVLESTSTIINN